MASLPVSKAAVVGLNWIVSLTIVPGLLSVSGKLAPETVNPAPDGVIELTVTGPVPVEVMVKDCVEEEPTATSPKLKLEALSVICGAVAAIAAVPEPPMRHPTNSMRAPHHLVAA
jgi:hypothetical protein